MAKQKITTASYYEFGYKYFGPFLQGFVSWLYNYLEKLQIKKVYFFARDGFMMQKAFEVISQDSSIKHTYVYFSRAALRSGLIYGANNYEDSLKHLSWSRFIRFQEILEYYGFSESEIDEISRNTGIAKSTEYEWSSIPGSKELKQIYDTYSDKIRNRSKESFLLIKKYLEQINMSGKCAIVDIGWHGNMQIYLQELINACHIEADITGFYVGIESADCIKSKVRGFLFDNDNLKLRKKVLCFFGGYERLFQSLVGSTRGYSLEKGTVVPVLQKYEYDNDLLLQEYIQSWQRGALDYIMKKGKPLDNASACSEAAMPLVKFGANPDRENLKLFYPFYNTDGGKIYYLPQKPLYRYKPKELAYALSNSVWKTGFMKALFKLPFPYYWIYNIIRK